MIASFFPKIQYILRKLCINNVKFIRSLWNVSANNMIPYLEQNTRKGLSSEDQKRGSIYWLDSHVDTNYASKHARIIEVIEDRSCDFHPLNEDYYTSMKNIQYIHGMLSTYSTLVESMSIKLNIQWNIMFCVLTKRDKIGLK